MVTPTDRPKSVSIRCVIEVFGGVFVLSLFFFFSVGVRAFVIGLTQISSVFSCYRCCSLHCYRHGHYADNCRLWIGWIFIL